MQAIAGKAVCFGEALRPEFGDYASIEQIAAAPRGHGLAGIASGARISARAAQQRARRGLRERRKYRSRRTNVIQA